MRSTSSTHGKITAHGKVGKGKSTAPATGPRGVSAGPSASEPPPHAHITRTPPPTQHSTHARKVARTGFRLPPARSDGNVKTLGLALAPQERPCHRITSSSHMSDVVTRGTHGPQHTHTHTRTHTQPQYHDPGGMSGAVGDGSSDVELEPLNTAVDNGLRLLPHCNVCGTLRMRWVGGRVRPGVPCEHMVNLEPGTHLRWAASASPAPNRPAPAAASGTPSFPVCIHPTFP